MKKTALLFLVLVLLAACESNDDDTVIFDMQVDVSILNAKSSYQLGDTLWMDINIPQKMLLDRRSGSEVSVSGATFWVSLLPVHFFDSDSMFLVTDRLEIITANPVTHPIADYPIESVFTFGCPDDQLALRVGVHFKDKGRFLFLLNRTYNSPTLGSQNPRSEILIPESGACSAGTQGQSIAYVEYVFLASDYNQAAFEAYMNDRIADPQNWDPETTQQQLLNFKSVFANQAAFFAEVQ